MSRNKRENPKQEILALCTNPSEYFKQKDNPISITTKIIGLLETTSINTEITVGSGIFSRGKTRTIFGHILKNWDSIVKDSNGKAFSEKQQTLLMQNLLTTDNIKRSNGNDYTRPVRGESETFNGPGGDAFQQKASGKYMFEYLLNSNASKAVIETVIFSGSEKKLDFDAIIERVSRQRGNPDQKEYMLNALKGRQLQEAISSNNIEKVSQCLDRITTQEEFNNIALLANPNTVSSASSILSDDSPPTQEDIELLSSLSSQSFSSEELSEGTGKINQEIHRLFATKEHALFEKPLDDLNQEFDKQSNQFNAKMSALYDSSLSSSNEELKDEADLSNPPPSRQQTRSASDEISEEILMAELEALDAEYNGREYDQKTKKYVEEVARTEQQLIELEDEFDKKWTSVVSDQKKDPNQINR